MRCDRLCERHKKRRRETGLVRAESKVARPRRAFAARSGNKKVRSEKKVELAGLTNHSLNSRQTILSRGGQVCVNFASWSTDDKRTAMSPPLTST